MLIQHRMAFLSVLLLLIAASDASAAAPHKLANAELGDGWISLFDSETLYGWRAASEVNWHVADGQIRADSGQLGLLCTTTQFADYQLWLDFRAAAGTNSGVFLRTSPRPKDAGDGCYELNIAPADNPFPTGSFVRQKKVAPTVAEDRWHTYEVTADGGQFSVMLDGKKVLEYTDPKPLGRGFIGLQFNTGAIAFRNIRLRPLRLNNLLNGRDLSGWKTDQARESEFSVTADGALRVQNGKGQIESKATYGDFVLQLECLVNGRELNSGVFFRSIPGEFWMGYESQIHNGTVRSSTVHNSTGGSDPNLPSNCGTGGIFRRQDARRVMARDFEWFHKTIVAEGPHMAVWVNGRQVSDWTDHREPHVNPRKGLRLDPGSIILQGHDPSTDLLFRGLRVAEMSPRR